MEAVFSWLHPFFMISLLAVIPSNNHLNRYNKSLVALAIEQCKKATSQV